MDFHQPLQNEIVTVIVATYNSADYVLETLESIKNQTYPNLELIISDDASNDQTCEIVSAWTNKADVKQRFKRIEVLTVRENTGVSANCNRGFKAAKSNWVKLIAGDDILLSNCIDDNMNFLRKNPKANVVFSKVKNYLNTFEPGNYIKTTPLRVPFYCSDPVITSSDQHNILLLGDRINYSPSCFMNRSAVVNIGGYDESNRLFEDYPMWLKLTKAGYRLYFMDAETVGYRKHNMATVNTNQATLFRPMIFKVNNFKLKNVYPYLPWDIVWFERFVVGVSWFFHSARLNRDTPALRSLYKLLTIYFNPFKYVIFFKKRVLRLGARNIFYRY